MVILKNYSLTLSDAAINYFHIVYKPPRLLVAHTNDHHCHSQAPSLTNIGLHPAEYSPEKKQTSWAEGDSNTTAFSQHVQELKATITQLTNNPSWQHYLLSGSFCCTLTYCIAIIGFQVEDTAFRGKKPFIRNHILLIMSISVIKDLFLTLTAKDRFVP